MQITVIGTGFVGVVTAAVYASFGHTVIGLDVDKNKVAKLTQGLVPFYEPGLEELLHDQLKSGRLSFTTQYESAIPLSDLIIIAVGTPSAADGQADLKYVAMAVESLAPYLKEQAIVAIKSTVPPGTLEKVTTLIKKHTQTAFKTAALPEFLREGTAVNDTLHPNRVVIGATDPSVFQVLSELHAPLQSPIVQVTPASAQMAKYAANAYLATRITFINQMADLCEKNGADIQEIIEAIALDNRIGAHYWYPGFGYGGSCFPKDVKELAAYSRAVGESNNLFNKLTELNETRISRLMTQFGNKVGGWQGKKVAVLGLAFKPNTDDMREAPSLKVVPYLVEAGAEVVGYDPRATWSTAGVNLDKPSHFAQAKTIKLAAKQADVIMALVEWPQIVSFEYSQVRQPSKTQFLIDARNQLNPDKIKVWGFTYLGVGR